MTTNEDGPEWSTVVRRVTVNQSNQMVIKDTQINGSTPETLFHQRLPTGVTSTKTILYYKRVVNIRDAFALHIKAKFHSNVATTRLSSWEHESDERTVSATEFGSHANSPVVGKFCKILRWNEEKDKVSGFSDR